MTTENAFNSDTTAEQVVARFSESIHGKTFLVTGVSPNGLGEKLVTSLATQNPRLLILTGRDLNKVQRVVQAVAFDHPKVQTRILQLDLASFESIRKAAAEVMQYAESIDVLINSAGVMNIPERRLSADNFELHLATNYLEAFLFTTSIIGKLEAAGGGRIVNVGSNGYALSPFRFADFNFENKALPDDEKPPKELFDQFGMPWSLDYNPTVAYAQSKTAILLFTARLAQTYQAQTLAVLCVNPGAIATELWRHMPKDTVARLHQIMPMKTLSQGVSTILVAALDPKLSGSSGAYLEDCQIHPVGSHAKDEQLAEKLWTLSKELTS